MERDNVKILIVEDSRTQAAELMFVLENQNFEVQHAFDGEKAFEMLKHFQPDVIISDIVMPGIDGFRFCSLIKADSRLKSIPVILLTSLSDPGDVIKGLECGADSFVVKPYNEQFLIGRIHYFLKNRKLRENQGHDSNLEIFFAEQNYKINSSPRQILDVLLSTYENSVLKNRELLESNKKLMQTKEELDALNASLEQKIRQRTEELEKSNELLKKEIEERKLIEKQLVEEEASARAIMESTPDTLILLDKDGNVIDTNEAHARRLNTTRKEMLGKNVFSFLPSDISDRRKEFINQVIANGQPVHGEDFRNDRWTDFSIFPVLSQTGQIEKVAVYAHDTTESRKAEREIKEREEVFRHFLENSPIYVFFKDENIRSLHLSRNFETMLGRPLEDLLGKSMDELFPSDFAKKMVDDDIRILKSGQKATLLEEFNGRHYSTIKFPIHIDGKPTFLAGYTIDVTEQRLTEEALIKREREFRQLAEAMPQIVWITKADGKNIYFNQQWVDYTGLSLEESYGDGWNKPFHPDDRLRAWDAWQNAVANNDTYSLDCQLKRKDGKYFWWLIRGVPIHDDNGMIIKWFGTCTDIHEFKMAELAVAENEYRMRELNATKDKFFSIIAHDLKSPFATIIGFSKLLQEQVLAKDYDGVAEFARHIEDSSERAMDLLTNLLEWSRSQTGRILFKPENVKIDALIKTATDLLTATAIQKNINIRTEVSDNVEVFVDKAMINTILRNLLSNAVKYTHSGGEIIISSTKEENQIVIRVKDNGIGIKAEALNKLFRLDQNNSTLGTNNEKGTGLGLLLCKEFIEKHNGKIGVESEWGKGSSFYFTIPLRNETVAESDHQ